jgi:hypothetical protein
VAAALLPLRAHAQAQAVETTYLRSGDVVKDPIRIGRRQITLPSGNWQLVAMSERNSSTDGTSSSSVIQTLHFQEIIDGTLTRMLEVSATKYSAQMYWLDEPCKTKGDSYWIETRKRGVNDEFCRRVGFIGGVVDQARGESFIAWARDLKQRAIKYSPEMPFVSVVRYTRSDYLRMAIQFNPSVSGIPPSKESTRQFNEWNGKLVTEGTRHYQFYEALREWAPTFADAVDRASKGDESLTAREFERPKLPPRE